MPPLVANSVSVQLQSRQAEEKETMTLHLKVTEDAFDITQYPLPVRPVCLQHLLHCLLHSKHEEMKVVLLQDMILQAVTSVSKAPL